MTLHNAHMSQSLCEQGSSGLPLSLQGLWIPIVHFMTALSERVRFLYLADQRRSGIFWHTADTRQENRFHLCHIIELLLNP